MTDAVSTPRPRPATPADAPAVARIWESGWRDGHLGNVPDELVAVRTPESFEQRAAERVADTIVCDVDGEVAGFVMVRGAEVDQVYVDAAHRGSGIAAVLLAAAEQRVLAGGHAQAWLAVVPGNERARRFYARRGWRDEGPYEHEAPVGDEHVLVTAHRYVKDVSPLVSATELRQRLGEVTLLDVRYRTDGPAGREEYLAGHVPGAVYVDLDQDLAGPPGHRGRHPLPSAGRFEEAMARAGVSDTRPVVVYDDWAGRAAARAWWLLRHHGHPDVRVLDGGWAAWVAAGGEVSTEVVTPALGDFTGVPGSMPVVDARSVPDVDVLLDARAPERYRGETEPLDPVAGHIPGARNVPTTRNLDNHGHFRDPVELREVYGGVGAVAGAEVAAYCGSGVTACHDVLALATLGIPAALYPGSWSEWVADPDRPVETGISRVTRPRIDTLLVLGADGDLTKRLLLPGLATLLAGEWGGDRSRPPLLLAAGLGEMTDTAWRKRVRTSFASADVRGKRLTEVARRTRYRQADVTDVDTLTKLLGECDGTPAIYFALPPAVTAQVCRALAGTSLPQGTVLAMEKPFGVDRESAVELNELVGSLVPEDQVFRIDHFLGRADVLNILGLRFANRLLDPVWNNLHVASIDIVYDEDLALEGRAGYYDRAGALVDMIQSHLLQVMALLMMEPVASLDERTFRDAKSAVLRSAGLAAPAARSSRRARYTQGRLGRRKVPAYTREEGVDPRRRTETLAEVTLEVRNHRWAGVPVTLRSGKALGAPRKEAVITLRPASHVPDGLLGHASADTIRIGFKPPRLGIHLDVSGEGDPFDLEHSHLGAELDPGDMTAYGEVLAGILDGDPLLSVRGDVAEECWRIVEPVLAAWREDEVPMDTYPAGSEGPSGW